MNKSEIKEIKESIMDVKVKNFEQTFLTFIYCFHAYIRCILKFGINSKSSEEIMNVWYEYLAIINEEKRLHKNILKRLKKIEPDLVIDFLDELEEINQDTIEYYYAFLDDAEEACDLEREHRIIRAKKDFYTLIETDEYKRKLHEILISESDLVDFLKLSKDFIKFINEKDNRVIYLRHDIEEERCFYGVNYLTDEQNILKDIKLFIPVVINLETALIFIRICNQAYELYKLLNTEISKNDIERIQNIKEPELEFKELFESKQKALLLK